MNPYLKGWVLQTEHTVDMEDSAFSVLESDDKVCSGFILSILKTEKKELFKESYNC